ncbi:MAG: SAM-dependent methyltransferase [Chloroflexota bacterium]
MALRALLAELRRQRPELVEAAALIAAGQVLVHGVPLRNPASRVPIGADIVLRAPRRLHGELKLEGALAAFAPDLLGCVALDVGAAAGGFTRVLLAAGALRVYAVDAGHGQLLGSLRQDVRVVNLENTNLGELTTERIPEVISAVAIDVSYLSLAKAFPQLAAVRLASNAQLLALVKPMFELKLPAPPTAEADLVTALDIAAAAAEDNGWRILGSMPSPIAGHKGAHEFLLYARRETARDH